MQVFEQYIANLLQDLICGDRTGNWEKQLRTVEKLLPIFQHCDSINYLRYANFYLEKMGTLPDEFPESYNHFKNGEFVVCCFPQHEIGADNTKVKEEPVWYNLATQQNNYVTEWELVYYKILNISNLFHGITSSRLSFRETDLHHELGRSISFLLNESTRKITTFLAER